jgi:hypothetical protein
VTLAGRRGRQVNSRHTATDAAVVRVTERRRGMWDVLGRRMLAADGGDADVRGFAGFGEGVVARVEVLPLLCKTASANRISLSDQREAVVPSACYEASRSCSGVFRKGGRGVVRPGRATKSTSEYWSWTCCYKYSQDIDSH